MASHLAVSYVMYTDVLLQAFTANGSVLMPWPEVNRGRIRNLTITIMADLSFRGFDGPKTSVLHLSATFERVLISTFWGLDFMYWVLQLLSSRYMVHVVGRGFFDCNQCDRLCCKYLQLFSLIRSLSAPL